MDKYSKLKIQAEPKDVNFSILSIYPSITLSTNIFAYNVR
jgi:hypothetical protein